MLGAMHAQSFQTDPKHLGFVLARYKFVAKMLQGKERVLEVGCGDGTGAQIVRPVVGEWVGIDREEYPGAKIWDMVEDGPYKWESWDAIYALDVLEHIPPEKEGDFLANVLGSLRHRGVLIIGCPSLESQPFASELSKLHHVNCKTEEGLRESLRYWKNVFIFGMNDETLHTGFGPMCHYRLAICV